MPKRDIRIADSVRTEALSAAGSSLAVRCLVNYLDTLIIIHNAYFDIDKAVAALESLEKWSALMRKELKTKQRDMPWETDNG